MNDKNRQRHIAYEVLVILGQLALLTYITRLWPILLLVILGIFVAALRLLFLSSQKVEPVRPLPTLSPPRQPPTEKDLQSAAYTIIQCRVTQILRAKFPEVRWVWENPRAMEDILAGKFSSNSSSFRSRGIIAIMTAAPSCALWWSLRSRNFPLTMLQYAVSLITSSGGILLSRLKAGTNLKVLPSSRSPKWSLRPMSLSASAGSWRKTVF